MSEKHPSKTEKVHTKNETIIANWTFGLAVATAGN